MQKTEQKIDAMRIRNYLILVSCLFASASSQAESQPKLVDGLAAIVGDEAILLSDLDVPTSSPRFTQTLDGLIREKLVLSDCKKSGLAATDEEVEEAIQTVMRQNNLTKPALKQALIAQQMNYDKYRLQIGAQLCKMKLIQSKVRGRVQITEEDIAREYKQRFKKPEQSVRAHVYHLLFPVKKGAPDDENEKMKKRAKESLGKIRSGDGFFKVAKKLREESDGVNFADLGVIAKGEMVAAIDEIVFHSEPGQVAGPVRSEAGWHLIFIKEKVLGGEKALEEVKKELQNELFVKETERQFEKYVDELRASTYTKIVVQGEGIS